MVRRIGKYLFGPAEICLSADHDAGKRNVLDVGHAAQEARQACLNARYWRQDLILVMIAILCMCWTGFGLCIWAAVTVNNWAWDVLLYIFTLLSSVKM
jgi:hypothetical protein